MLRNRYVHAQESSDSAHRPDRIPPKTPPIGGEAANKPNKMFLALPGGTISAKMVTALGMKTPPPTPVNALMTMNDSKDLQNALVNEKVRKMARPHRAAFW